MDGFCRGVAGGERSILLDDVISKANDVSKKRSNNNYDNYDDMIEMV